MGAFLGADPVHGASHIQHHAYSLAIIPQFVLPNLVELSIIVNCQRFPAYSDFAFFSCTQRLCVCLGSQGKSCLHIEFWK